MKIIQINMMYERGSTGKIMKDLNDIIISHGDSSYIMYGYYFSNQSNTYKIKKGKGKRAIHIELIKTLLTGYHGYTSSMATRKMIKEIDIQKPDIIHLHNIHCGYVNIKILFQYISKKNIPVVWTLHDSWSYTGGCSNYYAINCTQWIEGCYKCNNRKQYPISLFFDRTKKQWINKKKLFTSINDMYIITPSVWLKKEVMKSFLNKYNIQVINNGINLDVFKPTKNNIKKIYNIEGKYIILCVADIWNKRKGISDIFELSRFIDDNSIIVIVGTIKKYLTIKSNKIIYVNRLQNMEDLAKWYSIADIYINPTYEDNFPTTNLEALACGTPVITYNTGGSPEAIDEKTGIITNEKNAISLFDAIKKVKQSVIKRNDCIQRAQTLFNKHIQFEKYYQLYKNIYKK